MNRAALFRLSALILLSLARPFAGPAAAAGIGCGDDPLVVFAASSLTDVVGEAAESFERDTGCRISVSVAGSSTLARQIAAGAPAGVYLSANREWVSWLTENAPDRLAGDPVTIARNGLVAVARATDSGDIAQLLSSRFAIGDPAHVPAGIYARAALETLGIWDNVSANAVFTENVRVALAMAARGDVGAAIVYSTDARLEPDLAITWRFDPATHPEITYEAVLLQNGGAAGTAFLSMLTGEPGREIFARHGFLPGGNGGHG